MPNPNLSTQEWYYHAPSKRTNQEPKEAPAPSQIPGLSNVPENPRDTLADDRQFRRKWIRDTDSDYIKLAKGGGRKGLLSYKDPPKHGTDPIDYARVDWFDHIHPEEEAMDEGETQDCSYSQKKTTGYRVLPDWYVHDEFQSENPADLSGSKPYASKRQIMSFDNMSAWERDNKDDTRGSKHNVKLPAIHKLSTNKHRVSQRREEQPAVPARQTRVRLPKIESESVNFKHLMAMGYRTDWFEEQKKERSDKIIQKQKQQEENEEKRAAQIRDAIAMRKPKSTVEEEKPLFKLSKFEKVQPRVKTFRT